MSHLISLALSLCLMSFVATAIGAAKTTRQSFSRKGSITGRVICEGGHMPVLLQVSVWTPRDRGNSRRVVIDEAGRFRADDLPPGAYFVNVYAPGYVSDDAPQSQRYYRIGDIVTLRLKRGGVITGTVTDSNGEPIAGVQVRAIGVRDAQGRRIRATPGGGKATDDRGIYRIYGIPPGSYQVVTTPLYKAPTEIEIVVPTYYPSSTRDTAGEVSVQAGQEVTNIDIRIRNEGGHTVSGVVRGAIPQDGRSGRVWVGISQADNGLADWTTMVYGDENNSFAIHGLVDGDYVVSARVLGDEIEAASAPVRAKVKGGDVTGLELKVSTLGSISGRMLLERKEALECKDKLGATLEESLLSIRRDLVKNEVSNFLLSPSSVVPDEKGEFKVVSLEQARYRIETRLPSEAWYVRSITLPAPNNKTIDLSAGGVAVKQGEKVSDLTITITEGAAAIRGKVVAATEGASLPSRLRLHLIPAEQEAAEDILRYREITIEPDATFALTNLAPGKYLMIVRPAELDESGIEASRPTAWDITSRKKLRSEAEAINTLIDLKPCDHLSDYLLRYAPASAKPARKR